MPVNQDGKMVLSEEDLLLVAYIEENFWTNSVTPPVGNIAGALSMRPETVDELLRNETIAEYLGSRGIPNPLVDSPSVEGLTAQQLFCANILLNAQDKSSLREKLKMAGVSVQQYYAWLNDSKFSGYLQQRAERVFAATEWQVRQKLVDNAVEGETQAIKLYFEMIGKYVSRSEHTVNVEGLLSQVVEIVSYFLDQQQMLEFANMIEVLLQTGTVPKKLNAIEAISAEA